MSSAGGKRMRRHGAFKSMNAKAAFRRSRAPKKAETCNAPECSPTHLGAFPSGCDGAQARPPRSQLCPAASQCCSERDFLEVYSVLSSDDICAGAGSTSAPGALPNATIDLTDPDIELLRATVKVDIDDFLSGTSSQPQLLPPLPHQGQQLHWNMVSGDRPLPHRLLYASASSSVSASASSDSLPSVMAIATERDADEFSVGSRRSRDSDCSNIGDDIKRFRREYKHQHQHQHHFNVSAVM